MEPVTGGLPSSAAPSQAGRRSQATIYDVARHAGVSPSTVSRALNKPGRINIDTERRVRAVAAELGYRLNPMARALPTGRTGMLGLILSDITNPVWFELVRGAERITASAGYTLVLAESQESPELEAQIADRVLPSVDGLVLVASRLPDRLIRELATQKALVVVNRAVADVPGIVPDIGPGVRAALDHLSALGHRRVAFLAGPATSWMSTLRWTTLLDEAQLRGMSIVEIGPGRPTLEGGREQLQCVRTAGVTAVVAYNDLMAIGLLHACREAVVAVPADLSIVGFDDIFGSDFTTPPITTIRTPLGLVGEEAVHRLVSDGDRGDARAFRALSTEFVERGSTAPPARS